MPGQRCCLVWALLVCLATGVLADDDRERSIMARLQSAEPIWLQHSGQPFLGLYTAPRGRSESLIFILLPALGMHPDWPVLIRPLRLALADVNHGSLSVQLPLPGASRDYDALLRQAEARVQVAIRYLQHGGDVALIGYGFGALVAARVLADEPPEALIGMVGINMRDWPLTESVAELMESILLPVLDIHLQGPDDADALDRRLAARRGGNRHYSQIALASDTRQFAGRERDLVELLVAWLRQVEESPPPAFRPAD